MVIFCKFEPVRDFIPEQAFSYIDVKKRYYAKETYLIDRNAYNDRYLVLPELRVERECPLHNGK